MKEIEGDPVIDEIREIRYRISARFDHDPAKLVGYYLELQKQYENRLIRNEGVGESLATRTAQDALPDPSGR